MKRTAGYTLLDRMRKKHILDKMKVTPITEYVNNYKIRLVATRNNNGQGENLLKNFFDMYPLDDYCQEDRRGSH
jgi:hypothetical protein